MRLNYGPRFRSSVVSARLHPSFVQVRRAPKWAAHSKEAQQRAVEKNASSSRNKHISLPGQTSDAPPMDEHLQAEVRMRERLKRCVELISFGIEELIAAPPPKRRHADERDTHTLHIHYMIDPVNKVATAAGMPTPEFHAGRKPGMQSHRKCINCGASTSPGEMTCHECQENP